METYQQYNDKLFSRWAPIYDGFELILSGIRKKVVNQINPVSKRVLDVATGTGSLAIELSEVATNVVGVDLSAKMLAVAKRKAKQENLVFQEMDASKMIFGDNEFDVVTISLGLHDMPLEVRTSVVQEVKRVLNPNGKLYIFEYDLPQNPTIKRLAPLLLNAFESKYYLGFIRLDLEAYLRSFGFIVTKKTKYLFGHLQLLELHNRKD